MSRKIVSHGTEKVKDAMPPVENPPRTFNQLMKTKLTSRTASLTRTTSSSSDNGLTSPRSNHSGIVSNPDIIKGRSIVRPPSSYHDTKYQITPKLVEIAEITDISRKAVSENDIVVSEDSEQTLENVKRIITSARHSSAKRRGDPAVDFTVAFSSSLVGQGDAADKINQKLRPKLTNNESIPNMPNRNEKARQTNK